MFLKVKRLDVHRCMHHGSTPNVTDDSPAIEKQRKRVPIHTESEPSLFFSQNSSRGSRSDFASVFFACYDNYVGTCEPGLLTFSDVPSARKVRLYFLEVPRLLGPGDRCQASNYSFIKIQCTSLQRCHRIQSSVMARHRFNGQIAAPPSNPALGKHTAHWIPQDSALPRRPSDAGGPRSPRARLGGRARSRRCSA